MIAIDLFAGLGGFTAGAVAAGVTVAWAANHWPLAVAMHTASHPEVAHSCQDLHQADWSRVPAHELLLASPCCQGHTRARGQERPHHDASRATAWAIVSAAEYHRPAWVIVENVPEFQHWRLYMSWRDAMDRLGYHFEAHLLDAADAGVPQHRRRIFLVGRRDRAPRLRLPGPLPHRPAATAIRFDGYPLNPIRRPGRAEATLARVERAQREVGRVCLVPYYGSGSGLTGRSIHRPIGTITTRDRWALVVGDEMRMLQPDEVRGLMGFAAGTALPPQRKQAIHLLGNAVCPPLVERLVRAVLEAA